MTNGETKLEMILGSLGVILERPPQRGIDIISGILKGSCDNDAETLLRLIQGDKLLLDLYLKGLKQKAIVRGCSWHPQYNDGKNAVIIDDRNIPVVVPNDYFAGLPNVSHGACRECYSRALKEGTME